MASEKELFVTKQYVPVGQPISSNDHTVVYKVKCMAEKGVPDGILKMYRKKNVKALYTRLQQLDYSEWPHIYNVKYFDESTLVVEEYLEGQTLAERMEQNRAQGIVFSEKEACDIMDKLCEAIDILLQFEPPIIHYDLRPSNIFITRSGAIRLLDFIPGTPKKPKPLHHMLEFLGGIFHEMLTGKPPKNRKCTYRGRFETIIRRCIEKSPEEQYDSIQELQEDVEHAKTHKPENALDAAGIPYTLTIPFQGTILAFEWVLLSFFFAKNILPTMCLFAVIFFIHCACFAAKRHSFMKENNVSLSIARKAVPILLLAAVFIVLSLAVSFLIVPIT